MRNGRLPRSPRWRSLSWEDKMRTLKSPTSDLFPEELPEQPDLNADRGKIAR
jgi:hypothetical protein